MRLVSQTFTDQAALLAAAHRTAAAIAAKSPLAVAGTKSTLLFQRDHSVHDGLTFVAHLNASLLPQSADLAEVFAARAEGLRPLFSKL